MAACVSTFSVASTADAAARELVTQLLEAAGGERIAGGFVQASVAFERTHLAEALARYLPADVPFVGVTSCQGLATDRGLAPAGPGLAGLWLLGDDVRFRVGVTTAPDAPDAAEALTPDLEDAPAAGTQRFAVFHSTPGHEERLVEALAARLGAGVHLIGGTAADDDLTGKWSVFANGGFVAQRGAVLAVVDWPGKVAASLQATAMVTPQRGLITRVEGRTIYEIDGRPAAQVYNEWTGGAIERALRYGGSILNDTTLQPLAVYRPQQGGGYVLIHPESVVLETGALTTFKRLRLNDEIWLMKASRASFIGRPAAVVERLMIDSQLPASEVKGCFLVYCAGCKLTVQEGTPLMLAGFRGAVGHVPFTTGYFFGEQGCSTVSGTPEHGNLMTGALLLGR